MTASGRGAGGEQGPTAPRSRVHSKTPHIPSIPRALAIKDSLIDEALYILERVNTRFGGGDAYLEQIYGPSITTDKANRIIVRYLRDEGLHSHVKVKWSPKLTCSACLLLRGYSRKVNKPEKRRYTLMLSSSTSENLYLREKAVLALADHEIGTHYVCA